MPSLQVLTGPLSGVTHRLEKTCTMGRSPACDIALDDVRASRRHAGIQTSEGRWQIADLGSRNGTFVNGVRIVGSRALLGGDYIRIGATTALFLEEVSDSQTTVASGVALRWASSMPDTGICFSENSFDVNLPPIMVGADPGYLRAVALAREFSKSKSFIFLEGETGTGKTRLGWHAHSVSPARHLSWVGVDCLSSRRLFAQSLSRLSSEFSLTNAEVNQGCTLFLRRIDKLPVESIPEVTETIEQLTRRLSGNLQLYASSTEESAQLSVVKELARLFKVRQLRVPPLRERALDVVPLVEHYLMSFSNGLGKDAPVLHTETKRVLSLYSWPGNVREVKTFAERCVLLSSGKEVSPNQLPPEFHASRQNLSATSLEVRLSQVEKDAVLDALRQTRGKKIHAAKILGVSRPTLDKKITEYKIELIEFRK